MGITVNRRKRRAYIDIDDLPEVEVFGGCKVCGKRMFARGSPMTYRTCDKCKAKQRREHNHRLAEKRKAERHAFKADMGVPRCQQCGEAIEDAGRLTFSNQKWLWARKYCGNTCRQAAFRAARA